MTLSLSRSTIISLMAYTMTVRPMPKRGELIKASGNISAASFFQ